MNINLNEPCRWLSDSTTAENEIREIFFKHWEKLRDRFILNVNEINAWRQRLIEHTNQYADEQIRILADDFQLQRVSFDEKREENLDTTRAYCGVQNVELFTELCCACRSLEFQVAQLENINGTMVGIKVVTVSEQIERRNKEKSDASSISTNENIAEKSTFKHNDGTTDNPDEINSRNNTVTSSTLNQIEYVSILQLFRFILQPFLFQVQIHQPNLVIMMLR